MAEPKSKGPTLDQLKDGRFNTEPKAKGKTPGWTFNSRYLMCHLIYNVLQQKFPPRTPKDKLPSIDADALSTMEHPIPHALLKLRSDVKTLQSIQNAAKFIRPAEAFGVTPDQSPSRAIIRYATLGYDNVERVFTLPDLSIPLNVDKRARNAFITPITQTTLGDAVQHDPRNAALLEALLQPAS